MAPRKRGREQNEEQGPGSDDSVRSVRRRLSRSPDSSAASDVDAQQASESKASEASTALTEQSDEDSDSDLSSSSEEPSDDSEESESDEEGSATEDERTTIIPQSKLAVKPSQGERESALELRMKLREFLPQMEAANRDLEAARLDGSLEEKSIERVDEDGEEQYIEMDLGLGVLEHAKGAPDEEEEDSGDEADTEHDAARGGDVSVMDTLLRRKVNGKSAVKVVEDVT